MMEWPVLFLTGVLAGGVDSIAGGGGLITLPVLLNLGLPPRVALGTNKLQAVFGSGSATLHYGRAGAIEYRASLAGVGFTAIGAATGVLTVQQLRPDFLRALIPWLLISVALYFLVRPQLGEADARARWSRGTFHWLVGLTLGFFDGFLGPGTGSFWALAYVLLLGFNLTKATAHTKLMNFTSNAVALAVFAFSGHVQLLPGLTMGAGQLLGAWFGSKLVIRRGPKLIRPIFIVVTLAITVRLLFKP